MTPLRIFVGVDPKETLAYAVLSHSIIARASRPFSITPVARRHLRGYYNRSRGPLDSTDFSGSRWAIPAMCDFKDELVLWMDPDMLCRADIFDLMIHYAQDQNRSVWVVKHDYTPRGKTKMDGAVQTTYSRKNWSSLMLLNPSRCKALTWEYIDKAPGLDLHGFKWLPDDEIGSLPPAWNHLVGEYPPNPNAKILHYTLGGPWFEETRACDHADLWLAERDAMQGTLVAA